MKIRNGFVSNSSSSSFVVAFKEEPKSVEEVQEVLFGDHKEFVDTYDTHIHYSAESVAVTVFEDIKKQTANNKKEIKDAFYGHWLDEINYNDFKGDDDKIDWEAVGKAESKLQEKCYKKFMKDNPNCFIYTFSYGDNEGAYFSTLEHGDLFWRLPHIRISHH